MHGNLALRDLYRLGQNTPAGRLLGKERSGLAMSFLGDRGSMVVRDPLTPANNFNGVPYDKLTYTSPSAKMCMQSDGVLRYGAHNLCTFSEDFANANWAISQATLTSNATANPLDGSATADLVTENTATATHQAIIITGPTLVTGLPYYVAAYIKPNGRTQVAIQGDSGATNLGGNVVFDVTGSGSVLSVGSGVTSAAIEALANGWYRCSLVATATGTSGRVSIRGALALATSYTGDGTSGFYVFGVQISRYPAQTTYLSTTSTAAYELPYEWDSSGVPLGIRVEEARTNLCLRSQELDNGTWTISGVTVTANAGASPDGTTTADRIVSSAGSIYQSVAVSASTSYTFSFYAKNNGGTIARYQVYDVTHGADIVALETSYFSQINSSTFTRVSVTFTTPVGCTNVLVYPQSSSSPGADLLVWGAQLELGSFATSYIPTVASTVTRATDQIRLGAGLFPFGAAATIYSKFVPINQAGGTLLTAGDFATARGQIGLYISGRIPFGYTYVSSAGQFLDSTPTVNATVGVVLKIATRSEINNFKVTSGANSSPTDTSGTAVALNATDVIQIASNQFGGVYPTGYIQEAMYLPRGMTNAELQTVTS